MLLFILKLYCAQGKKLVWNEIHGPNKKEKGKIRSNSCEPNSYGPFSSQSTRTGSSSSKTATFIVEETTQLPHIHLIVSFGSNKLPTFKSLV